MTSSEKPTGRRAPIVIGGVVAVIALGVGVWMTSEAVWQEGVTEALAPYAGAPLPTADAPVDETLAQIGSQLFRKRCSACHTINGESRAGPDLAGVTDRRTLSWMRSLILAPDSMTANDPQAAALREEYGIQMSTPRSFDERHARALIEFLRQVDGRAGS